MPYQTLTGKLSLKLWRVLTGYILMKNSSEAELNFGVLCFVRISNISEVIEKLKNNFS